MSQEFRPGVRFSAADLLFLAAAGAFAWWAWERGAWLAGATLYVVGNFFLFCNVFRIGRSAELSWSVVFVVLTGIRLQTGSLSWWTIYGATAILTAFLIGIEMRKASYHGVGWSRINPGLKDWWLQRRAKSAPE
ncbi:hypothetical protein Pan44_22760 [Caulifigura coniformis]|uniref:Uncharacterized protein n=1 Tax=Caulifigura coniformis TaxID=2527983 RepID=A0A517SDQ0_9PLAN|nr:hypothetical protein [Caulifigura coniformis]QDT54248.1 hypothetical protein Pan44_22760 [Caulifigura coniformis]